MIEEIRIGDVYVYFSAYEIKVVKVIRITKTTVWFWTGSEEDWRSLKEFREYYFTPEQFKCLVDEEVAEFIEKNKQR